MPTIRNLVAIVRSDPYLGKGSQSYIDETCTDKELAFLVKDAVRTLGKEGEPVTGGNVLRKLTQLENLWRERDAEAFAATSESRTSKDYPLQPIVRKG